MQKIILSIGLLLSGIFNLSIGHTADNLIEGTISEYICGDNCYLTIVDKNGEEHGGLCGAALCEKWNEAGDMPVQFKGRAVRVTVGKGYQYDGEGNVMDEVDEFKKVDLLKSH